MKSIISLLFGVTALLLMSCASQYNVIKPESLNYSNRQNCNNKLEVSYIYDIYTNTDNRKYAKREKNNNYRAIAVRIKNLTDTSRFLTPEIFRIYANDQEISLVDNTTYLENVRQYAGSFLLYGLGGPWIYEETNNGNQTSSKLTYYPVGLAIGVGNLIFAAVANANHKKDIEDHYIYGKTIRPGETITGIILLNYSQYEPLVFKYLDK